MRGGNFNMGSLIMKDLRMLKYKWNLTIIAILIPVSYGFAAIFSKGNDEVIRIMYQLGFSIAGALTVFLLCVLIPLGYEDQNGSEMILRSFPVKSYDLVISKYIYTVIMFLAWIVISKIGPVIFYMGIKEELTVEGLQLNYIGPIALVYFLVSSIYLSLYFKFGYMKIKVVNIVLYLIIILMPNIMKKYFSYVDVEKIKSFLKLMVGAFGSIEMFLSFVIGVIFIFSCLISIWVSDYREV